MCEKLELAKLWLAKVLQKYDRHNCPSVLSPTLKAALHHIFQKLSLEECMPMMSSRDFFLESRDYSLHGH